MFHTLDTEGSACGAVCLFASVEVHRSSLTYTHDFQVKLRNNAEETLEAIHSGMASAMRQSIKAGLEQAWKDLPYFKVFSVFFFQ